MRAMVALVSGQRMQNVIPCFQKGLEFAEVHLVRSREADVAGSSMARAWRDTRDTLANAAAVHDAEPAIDAYDVRPARETVRAIIEHLYARGLEPVVNFTGGTKCMAVGAYLAAVEAGCVALYVDTQNERLLWYFPDGRVIAGPFDLKRVDISLYLKAYGLTVSQHGRPELVLRLAPLLETVLAFWPRCASRLEEGTR